MKFSKNTVITVIVLLIVVTAEVSSIHETTAMTVLRKRKSNSKKANNSVRSKFESSNKVKSGTESSSSSKNKLKSGTSSRYPFVSIPEGCVMIYSECNYQGESLKICDNVADYGRLWHGKQIKSLVVSDKDGSYFTFAYFFSSNYYGDSWSVDNVIQCIEDPRPIKSSYMVKKGCAVLYRECEYTDNHGAVLTCQSIPQLGSSFPKNALSSIISTRGATVELFEGNNYTGKRTEIKAWHPCLPEQGINKSTLSIKITPAVDPHNPKPIEPVEEPDYPPKPPVDPPKPPKPPVDPPRPPRPSQPDPYHKPDPPAKKPLFEYPHFEDGTYKYTHVPSPKFSPIVRTFTLTPRLPAQFDLTIKIHRMAEPSKFSVGFSTEPLDVKVMGFLGGRAPQLSRDKWSYAGNGAVAESGSFNRIRLMTYESGDTVTFKGDNGTLTVYKNNHRQVNYSYRLPSKYLYLGFSMINSDTVEVLRFFQR